MPELPEVELARENLAEWLVGRRIREVRAPDARIRRGQEEAEIRAAAEGRRVAAVRRRAKYLLFDLDGPAEGSAGGAAPPGLLGHLGMTGKWVRRRGAAPDPPAARAEIRLSGGERVVFADRRRFGRFSLRRPEDDARLARLGPEPLARAFTARVLAERLGGASGSAPGSVPGPVSGPVKVRLMDQGRIAGLGNIQVSEALWRAGVHPARPAASLGESEVRRLHRAIRETLRRTIREARGIEIRYVSEGRAGNESAQNRFSVYAHEGETCPKCRKGVIRRRRLAGRSSFYCPRCQPRRPPPGPT